MVTRRSFLTGSLIGGLAAPGIVRAQGIFRDYPFSLGVAAGDPAPDGFVIWTRIAPQPLEPHGGVGLAPLPVQWEVAADDRFARIVAKGEAIARPELAHSVHVEVSGLEPDRPYWYRFDAVGERSIHGRARTLPAPGSHPTALNFAVAGCQNYEDGYYGAFRHLAREENIAFVYHYGDYIYEYGGSAVRPSFTGQIVAPVRQHIGRMLYDVADYRQRYAQYKSDPDLQRAHAAHAFVPAIDDHEIDNNWVGDIDEDATPPEIFALRRAAAMQAWYEHMPVRRSRFPRGGQVALYHAIDYGDLARIEVLDTRQFRSDQPCGDGFKPRCAGVGDPAAEVLGREQEAWLARNLAHGGTRWNCLAQQITLMALDRRRLPNEPDKILNLDSWAAYDVPRQRLLARLRGLGNAIVLTGDEHQNFAGLLNDGERVVGAEFVATSMSSGGDGADQRGGTEQFLRYNPELVFANDQRGYLRCEVSREAWRTHFMVVDRVSTRDNTLSRRATGEVAHGEPGLRMV